MYKVSELQSDNGTQCTAIIRADGWTIPADPANADYQAYLKWIAEGNTPEPADTQGA